jgi:hypothetical protein
MDKSEVLLEAVSAADEDEDEDEEVLAFIKRLEIMLGSLGNRHIRLSDSLVSIVF